MEYIHQAQYYETDQMGIISPVLSVQCDYKSMTHFGDRVAVEVRLISYNGLKYTISYTMRDEKTREVRAKGTSKHCYLRRDGHPVSVKKALPCLHEKMMLMLEDEA